MGQTGRMFSDFLFDHKFDIDDLIRAFCGSDYNGQWWLNSRTGELLQYPEAEIDQLKLVDGSDHGHLNRIIPLPFSFVSELKKHEARRYLAAEDLAQLDTILHDSTETANFINHFEQGRAGGWLRERVKEAVIEWLGHRDMIPPSMLHVQSDNIFAAPPSPHDLKDAAKIQKKVVIQ